MLLVVLVSSFHCQACRLGSQTTNRFFNYSRDISNFTLDSLSLVRWIDRADGALSHQVLRDIDVLRYQIEHIENKMQMLYSIASNYGSHTAVAHHEFGSTLAHLKMAVGWISERKRDVEKAG
jgi:hypothetical protein